MKRKRLLCGGLALLLLLSAASCGGDHTPAGDGTNTDEPVSVRVVTDENGSVMTIIDEPGNPVEPDDKMPAVSLATEADCPLQFSHAPGFYDEGFALTLSVPEGWTVYYTTNGSDPTSSTARRAYTEPLTLESTYDMSWGPATIAWFRYAGTAARPSSSTLPGGYVIKAYAEKDGEKTPVYTASYFIAPTFRQYGVKVISLSLPIGSMLGTRGFYSNYNPEDDLTATRPRGVAEAEIFSPEGVRMSYSTVELSVSGNGSSGAFMKSLRVYYKKALNPDGNRQSAVKFDLFDGLALDADGDAIEKFSRLVFRNSGNDCGSSYLRDAYMQRVCAGLKCDTMASASALLFVNGEFWGLYNVRERYSPEYVEAHYGVDKDNVCIIENDYSLVHTNTNAPFVVCNGEEGDEKPFNDLVRYIKTHDMAKDSCYEKVASQLDVDSLIDMCVARIYFNAIDWPENNIKVWRNKDPDDPSGVDTKWHFTLLDMDMGLAYYDFTDETESIFGRVFGDNCVVGNIMLGLIENETFRRKFICRYYELTTEFFTSERLLPVFEELAAERSPLMGLQAARWPGDDASTRTFKKECEKIRSFLEKRNRNILRQLYTNFGLKAADVRQIVEEEKAKANG